RAIRDRLAFPPGLLAPVEARRPVLDVGPEPARHEVCAAPQRMRGLRTGRRRPEEAGEACPDPNPLARSLVHRGTYLRRPARSDAGKRWTNGWRRCRCGIGMKCKDDAPRPLESPAESAASGLQIGTIDAAAPWFGDLVNVGIARSGPAERLLAGKGRGDASVDRERRAGRRRLVRGEEDDRPSDVRARDARVQEV